MISYMISEGFAMNEIEKAKQAIAEAKRIVFLGGAGVSTASGIPDFRSPEGLFRTKQRYGVSYETLLSHTYFFEHPERFYEFYWQSMVYRDAKPNAAHIALAEYEKRGGDIAILTQNIDGLHEMAGSKRVYNLHGSVYHYHCLDCGKAVELQDIHRQNSVPHCECGGILKPDVVLYEEPLDENTLFGAIMSLRRADVLIVGGTSLNVYPAAGLIYDFHGAKSILINREETPLDAWFDIVIHDDVGKVLTEILR